MSDTERAREALEKLEVIAHQLERGAYEAAAPVIRNQIAVLRAALGATAAQPVTTFVRKHDSVGGFHYKFDTSHQAVYGLPEGEYAVYRTPAVPVAPSEPVEKPDGCPKTTSGWHRWQHGHHATGIGTHCEACGILGTIVPRPTVAPSEEQR